MNAVPDATNVLILTVSDTRSRGVAVDETRELLGAALTRAGFREPAYAIVPDERDAIAAVLRRAADEDAMRLVLTTGGTGLGPRDVTPEATLEVVDRVVPGICELFRHRGAQSTPMAWLSRAVAGLRGSCLIVNVPGKPAAAVECVELLIPLLDHALDIAAGASHPSFARTSRSTRSS